MPPNERHFGADNNNNNLNRTTTTPTGSRLGGLQEPHITNSSMVESLETTTTEGNFKNALRANETTHSSITTTAPSATILSTTTITRTSSVSPTKPNNTTNNNHTLASSKTTSSVSQASSSGSSNTIPRWGMLVDRSSFDETESYGVDRRALETQFDAQKLNSGQSTVLRNGKVRRRMRWRPKKVPTNQKMPPHRSKSEPLQGGTRASSSPHTLLDPSTPQGSLELPSDTNNNKAQGLTVYSSNKQATVTTNPSTPAARGRSRLRSDSLGSTSESPSSDLKKKTNDNHNNNSKAPSLRTLMRNNKHKTTARSGSDAASVGESSRASQKSVHSLASTRTEKQGNTRGARGGGGGRFPLPRPNYSTAAEHSLSTIAGHETLVVEPPRTTNPTTNTTETTSSTASTTPQKSSGWRLGGFGSSSRSSSSSTPGSGDPEARDPTSTTSETRDSTMLSEDLATHHQGKPPTVNSGTTKKRNKKLATKSSPPPTTAESSLQAADTLEAATQRPPRSLSPPPVVSRKRETPSPSNVPSPNALAKAMSTTTTSSSSRLPSLATHDLLSERRVDLRIPSPSSSTIVTQNSPSGHFTSTRSASSIAALGTNNMDPATPPPYSSSSSSRGLANTNGTSNPVSNGSVGVSVTDIDDMSIHTDNEEEDTDTEESEDEGNSRRGKTPKSPIATKRQSSTPTSLDNTSTTEQGRGGGTEALDNGPPSREQRFSMDHTRATSTSPLPSFGSQLGPVAWANPQDRTNDDSSSATDAASRKPKNSKKNLFRGSKRSNKKEDTPSDSKATPPASPLSVPIDLDDGTFLDAEKNLQAIHEIGIEHLRHMEYAEALEVFEEILRGQLTRYGKDHPRVGTALHNIGLVHMKRGSYSEAARVCREAVRVRQVALGKEHADLAVSLAQLGVAYLELGKHKKAIVNFRQALRIRRRAFGPKHPKVAKILNNIGCGLYELNELQVAKVAFEEALDIQRETLRMMMTDESNVVENDNKGSTPTKRPLSEPQDDTPNQVLLSIASTLCNIGSIRLYWGHFNEANVDLEEALLIQQSVLGDDHPLSRRTVESLEWISKKQQDVEAAKPMERNASANYQSDLQLCQSDNALLSLSREPANGQKQEDESPTITTRRNSTDESKMNKTIRAKSTTAGLGLICAGAQLRDATEESSSDFIASSAARVNEKDQQQKANDNDSGDSEPGSPLHSALQLIKNSLDFTCTPNVMDTNTCSSSSTQPNALSPSMTEDELDVLRSRQAMI